MKFFSEAQVVGLLGSMQWSRLLNYVEDMIVWLTRLRDFLSLKIAIAQDQQEVLTSEEALSRYGAELHAMIETQPDTDNYTGPSGSEG